MPVVHQQWRNVTFLPERDLRGSLSESRRDLLVISFNFHVQSEATKVLQFREGRPPPCLFFFLCALGRASLEDINNHKAAAKVETFGRLTILTDRTNWAAWDLFIHSYLVSWVNFSVYLLETIEQVTILFYLNTFNEQERSRKKKKKIPRPFINNDMRYCRHLF